MRRSESKTRGRLPAMWRRAQDERGSQLAELAISLPLLVVFVVGIFDFSNAYNLRQKLTTAADEGAIAAAAMPTNDLDQTSSNGPPSVRTAADVAFNYLINENVLPLATQGGCVLPTNISPAGLTWTYVLSDCPGTLTIVVNRGIILSPPATSPKVVGTQVSLSYTYQWQFNRVISLLSAQNYNLPGTIGASGNAENLF